MSYVIALSQVVREVVVDVRAKPAAILWVQTKHLPQGPNTDILQVTVGQCLNIGVGLDHLVMFWKISPDKIPFACRKCG